MGPQTGHKNGAPLGRLDGHEPFVSSSHQRDGFWSDSRVRRILLERKGLQNGGGISLGQGLELRFPQQRVFTRWTRRQVVAQKALTEDRVRWSGTTDQDKLPTPVQAVGSMSRTGWLIPCSTQPPASGAAPAAARAPARAHRSGSRRVAATRGSAPSP